jgi:hypothetical protein
LKQALASQHRPRHLQCPLGQAPLVTVYKNADLQHASQLQLHLHRDSLSGAQTSIVSHVAATLSADTRKTSQLTLAANARKTSRLTVA